MTECLMLPVRLDSSGARSLMDMILARRGAALTLDASQVDVIGALAVEVLVAAGRQWQADGHTLAIANPSDRYAAACKTMGLSPESPWLSGVESMGVAA